MLPKPISTCWELQNVSCCWLGSVLQPSWTVVVSTLASCLGTFGFSPPKGLRFPWEAPIYFPLLGAHCWGTCLCAAASPRKEYSSVEFSALQSCSADVQSSFRNFIPKAYTVVCPPILVVLCQAVSSLGFLYRNLSLSSCIPCTNRYSRGHHDEHAQHLPPLFSENSLYLFNS